MFLPSVRYSLGVPKQTFSFVYKKEEDKEGPSNPTRETANSGTLTLPEAGFEFKSKLFNIYTHHTKPTVHHFYVQCYKLYHYFLLFSNYSEDLNVSFFPWLLLVLKKNIYCNSTNNNRTEGFTSLLV